jgi:predicted secreted Zn-dependent protease
MTGRRAALALALALGLVVGACIPPTTQDPSPTATTSANTTASPVARTSQPPRSPAPTPATILALDVGQRPSGPWAVSFQLTGTPAIREVYVLAPACDEASCDINATIQTFAGEPLGTGVFRFADGMYRYEADRTETVECNDGFETIPDGATRVSHTILLIAGYRLVGTAVVSVDMRGTRAVTLTPVGGRGCSAETLDYAANGEATRFAVAPTPTPKPTAAPTVPVIGGSFYGSGAKVVSYQVSGSSMAQIIASIRANGPWSDWIHARAEAVTKAVPKYRFTLTEIAGVCHIVPTARPAVIFTYTITLPGWSRPKTAGAATVRWWAGELLRVATHERHHVEIYRDGAARMTEAVAHSTCGNVSSKIAAIVKDIDTQQCQFDVDEYGAALGLTLSSCLAQ